MATLVICACKKEEAAPSPRVPMANKSPVVNAGPDMHVFFQVNSCILKGSVSDPENEQTQLIWRRLYGTLSYSFEEASSAETRLYNLDIGNYAFELAAKDPHGGIGRDTILVFVFQPPPGTSISLNAGQNVYLTFPNTSAELNALAANNDNIASVIWKKVSGPTSYHIENPYGLSTKVQNLEKGEYEFEVTVRGISGEVYVDTVNVYVFDPSQKEYVIGGLGWSCPLGCSVGFTVPATVPAGADLQVTARGSYVSNWAPVKPIKDWTGGNEYVYELAGSTIWIYANDDDGKVDVRIKW